MSIRFTSQTHPDALIKMLNSLRIRYEKLGVNSLEISYLADSPYRIAVFDGPERPPRLESFLVEAPKNIRVAILESIEPDTVIEIQANTSTFLAETVVRSLPSGAILDIGHNLQIGQDSNVGRFSPICTALKDLPIGSRVRLRSSLRRLNKSHRSSIYAITSSFHGKLIGVSIDPDMNPGNIASINLSSDCFVYLDDALSDKIIKALGMNKNIRNFDVTQLSGNNCKKLQEIIEGRDHIVELRCKTAEQRDVFHNKPGVTILMPGAIQRNPLTKDRNAALALLDLQRRNEMEEPDDPQAQSVTPSRKSRLPSPDSIGDHIHEDASSDSEHANNKRQRRMIVTPEQEESDALAKGDDETTRPNRLRDDDAIDEDDSIDYAVSDNTWCEDDAIDDDEYTDDDSEPSPSPK
ncbi:MAG TPA: hypothetical protein DCW33_04260 [Proteobacteria bacterium]|nr:hypothetical protein [Pseudomonadota bacterium]|tara:strand:+ start:99 stop:1322 length:1224 start_codon:yes stop_codon:yes gene_type:complete